MVRAGALEWVAKFRWRCSARRMPALVGSMDMRLEMVEGHCEDGWQKKEGMQMNLHGLFILDALTELTNSARMGFGFGGGMCEGEGQR